jgi:hypothetical protein
MGYRATKTGDGKLIVHNVPIFVTCSRGDTEFNDEWIAKAMSVARQQQSESYLPPLHIRHHEDDVEVKSAGVFRIVGTEPITFKGQQRTAIMADLIITDEQTQADVMAMKFPYRSVEIFNVESPCIDSLALLDHEPPYLELPMLMVSEINEAAGSRRGPEVCDTHSPGATGGMVRAASAAFCSLWQMDTGETGKPSLAACFQRGASGQLIFREETNMTDKAKAELAAEEAEANKAALMAADEGEDKKDEGKSEDMEGESGIDVAAVAKAIEAKEISIGDMDMLLAAIQAARSEADTEEEPAEEVPAPAAVPGEAMSKKDIAAFAKLQGEVDGLRAKDTARDEADKRKSDVAAAMERFQGCVMGSDLEERLTKFHKDHKGEAFSDYVEELAKFATDAPDAPTAAFSKAGKKTPEFLMKYMDGGTADYDKAAALAKDWEKLQGFRHCPSISLERYVEINMGPGLAK